MMVQVKRATCSTVLLLLLLLLGISLSVGRRSTTVTAFVLPYSTRRQSSLVSQQSSVVKSTDDNKSDTTTRQIVCVFDHHEEQEEEEEQEEMMREEVQHISRRGIFRRTCATATSMCLWLGGATGTTMTIPSSSAMAYTIDMVEPDEKETYLLAQQQQQQETTTAGTGTSNKNDGLRILWVGCGPLDAQSSRLFTKDLFEANNEIVALDLKRPNPRDLLMATKFATSHGYRFQFRQGDATKLSSIFASSSFDVVLSSFFLCQDFDPELVCQEIRQVLKPNGRYGFFEHVSGEIIEEVVIGKVFGENAVIRVQSYPEMTNVIAGVVAKV